MTGRPVVHVDRPPEETARALLAMRPLNWLRLIETVSVTELVALARAYLARGSD